MCDLLSTSVIAFDRAILCRIRASSLFSLVLQWMSAINVSTILLSSVVRASNVDCRENDLESRCAWIGQVRDRFGTNRRDMKCVNIVETCVASGCYRLLSLDHGVGVPAISTTDTRPPPHIHHFHSSSTFHRIPLSIIFHPHLSQQ